MKFSASRYWPAATAALLTVICALPMGFVVREAPIFSLLPELLGFGLMWVLVLVSPSRVRTPSAIGAFPYYWLAWAVLTIASIAWSDYVYRSQWQIPLTEFVSLAIGTAAFVRLRAAYPEVDWLRAMAAGFVIGAGVMSIVGYWQLIQWRDPLGWFSTGVAIQRILGATGHPNLYALLLTVGTVAVVWLAADGCVRRVCRGLAIGLALWFQFAATWSGSRAQIVHLAIFGSAALLLAARSRGQDSVRRYLMYAAIVCAGGGAALVFPESTTRAFSTSSGTGLAPENAIEQIDRGGFAGRRLVEARKAWQVFMEHPLGVGWRNYAYESFRLQARPEFQRERESVLFVHSHNLFSQITAETGVLGLLLVAVALAWLVRRAVSISTARELWAMTVIAILLASSMLEFPLWYFPLLMYFSFLCAAIGPVPVSGSTIGARTWSVLRLAALVMVIQAAYGAYLYHDVIARSWYRVMRGERAIAALQPLRPFYAMDAIVENAMMNVFSRAPEQQKLRTAVTSRQARHYPAFYIQLKLICELGMAGETERRERERALFIAAYPDHIPSMEDFLKRYGC